MGYVDTFEGFQAELRIGNTVQRPICATPNYPTAYISLRCKTIRVGSSCCHNFALPTCWYLKMLKCALLAMQTLKFVLPPMPTPNASRWNIGGVGSPTRGACIGHVHFMLFVSISFALCSLQERDNNEKICCCVFIRPFLEVKMKSLVLS